MRLSWMRAVMGILLVYASFSRRASPWGTLFACAFFRF